MVTILKCPMTLRHEPAGTMGDAEELHVFVGVNVLVFIFIVCVCLFLGYVLKKYNFYYLPDSGASMLVGFVVGGFIYAFGGHESFSHLVGTDEASYVMFQPELFFFGLLPPIIFDAGYSLDNPQFFQNIGSILVFAVLGTIVSTVVIGYGLYGFALLGWVPLDASSPLESLIFGSLISAVDPVATLSILVNKRINADPLLTSLIFGESVLNDAVAIVLFNTLKGFHAEGGFGSMSIAPVMGQFIVLCVGSLTIGVAVALLCSFLFVKTSELYEYPAYEFTIIFLFAYGSYCLAEILHMSGIMSLFFCGIVMSHYASFNISKVSRLTTEHAFSSFALVAETFLFAYLGITAVIAFKPIFHLKWSIKLILCSMLLCLVSRALNIFPFSFLLNLGRKERIPAKMQAVMWFAGLRGAIAFALALNVPTQNRAHIITTSMCIVIVTTLLLGGLTEPLLSRLNLRTGPEPSGGAYTLVTSRRHRRSQLTSFWQQFDKDYMKPIFGGSLKSPDIALAAEQSRALDALDEEFDDSYAMNIRAADRFLNDTLAKSYSRVTREVARRSSSGNVRHSRSTDSPRVGPTKTPQEMRELREARHSIDGL